MPIKAFPATVFLFVTGLAWFAFTGIAHHAGLDMMSMHVGVVLAALAMLLGRFWAWFLTED